VAVETPASFATSESLAAIRKHSLYVNAYITKNTIPFESEDIHTQRADII
jgi:hypothetical protein